MMISSQGDGLAHEGANDGNVQRDKPYGVTMTTFEWVQAIALFGGLIFVAVQSYLMRRAVEEQRNQLRVQSCLQVWQAHVQTTHLPIATGSDEIARELNKMSPYHSLDLGPARSAHFADATMDLYECITLMSELGILDAEVARVWKDSVPYEMANPHLRAHWLQHHDRSRTATVPSGIYLQSFADMVDTTVRSRRDADIKLSHSEPHSLSSSAKISPERADNA